MTQESPFHLFISWEPKDLDLTLDRTARRPCILIRWLTEAYTTANIAFISLNSHRRALARSSCPRVASRLFAAPCSLLLPSPPLPRRAVEPPLLHRRAVEPPVLPRHVAGPPARPSYPAPAPRRRPKLSPARIRRSRRRPSCPEVSPARIWLSNAARATGDGKAMATPCPPASPYGCLDNHGNPRVYGLILWRTYIDNLHITHCMSFV